MIQTYKQLSRGELTIYVTMLLSYLCFDQRYVTGWFIIIVILYYIWRQVIKVLWWRVTTQTCVLSLYLFVYSALFVMYNLLDPKSHLIGSVISLIYMCITETLCSKSVIAPIVQSIIESIVPSIEHIVPILVDIKNNVTSIQNSLLEHTSIQTIHKVLKEIHILLLNMNNEYPPTRPPEPMYLLDMNEVCDKSTSNEEVIKNYTEMGKAKDNINEPSMNKQPSNVLERRGNTYLPLYHNIVWQDQAKYHLKMSVVFDIYNSNGTNITSLENRPTFRIINTLVENSELQSKQNPAIETKEARPNWTNKNDHRHMARSSSLVVPMILKQIPGNIFLDDEGNFNCIRIPSESLPKLKHEFVKVIYPNDYLLVIKKAPDNAILLPIKVQQALRTGYSTSDLLFTEMEYKHCINIILCNDDKILKESINNHLIINTDIEFKNELIKELRFIQEDLISKLFDLQEAHLNKDDQREITIESIKTDFEQLYNNIDRSKFNILSIDKVYQELQKTELFRTIEARIEYNFTIRTNKFKFILKPIWWSDMDVVLICKAATNQLIEDAFLQRVWLHTPLNTCIQKGTSNLVVDGSTIFVTVEHLSDKCVNSEDIENSIALEVDNLRQLEEEHFNIYGDRMRFSRLLTKIKFDIALKKQLRLDSINYVSNLNISTDYRCSLKYFIENSTKVTESIKNRW